VITKEKESPILIYRCEANKIKHHFMKLDISLQDLQNVIMTKVDPLENMSKNKRKGKVKSKLGVETTSRTNLGETVDLVPYFFGAL